MNKIKMMIAGAAMVMASANVSAFELIEVEHLYLVGGAVATGWNRGDAPELEQVSEGVYVWKGDMTSGDFKFLIDRHSWAAIVAEEFDNPVRLNMPMGVLTNDEGADHDAKWMMMVPGKYVLKVDINNATLTVTTGVDDSEVSTFEATDIDGVNYKVCEVMTSGSFVVKAYDEAGNARYLTVGENGKYSYVNEIDYATAFAVTQAQAHMQVLIDTDAKTVTSRSYTPWTEMYMVGGFNSWMFNDKLTRSRENPYEFEWSGEISLGASGRSEVKFKGNNQYTAGEDVWGVHPMVDGQEFTEADHIVLGGMADGKWMITREGNYTVRVNPFKLTASVTVEANWLRGDLNLDGMISVTDLTELINVILGDGENPRADVNEDGQVTVADVTALIDLMLN